MTATVHSYEEALGLFSEREVRGILNKGIRFEHDTYLDYPDEPRGTRPLWFAVRYDTTHIVRYHRDGRVELDSGERRTQQVRERMNRYLPHTWAVWPNGPEWTISFDERGAWRGERVPYEDHMILHPGGSIERLSDEVLDVV